MQGFESAIVSAVLGAAAGLTLAFFIRRWRKASGERKAAAPKVYASRQEMRKHERARMKAERSRQKRVG